MTIALNQREIDHLERAVEILEEYSRAYSGMVKGKTGTFHNTAGTAVNMINAILSEEPNKEKRNA